MADLGTAATGLSPAAIPAMNITGGTVVISGIPYGTVAAGLSVFPADTPPATGYQLAGTIDDSYHPPTRGQLWPRGDLDATE